MIVDALGQTHWALHPLHEETGVAVLGRARQSIQLIQKLSSAGLPGSGVFGAKAEHENLRNKLHVDNPARVASSEKSPRE